MAKKQYYYEDMEVGKELPTLEKVATTQRLVMWAGASGDFNPLHYEDTFAGSQGVGSPIIHGALKRSWLGHLATSIAGDVGFVKRFACQYRGMDYPRKMKSMTEPQEGETWLVKGTVTNKYVEGDEHIVECEIWVENAKGEKTTPGSAIVVLPSRG
jgi:hypothetical protein